MRQNMKKEEETCCTAFRLQSGGLGAWVTRALQAQLQLLAPAERPMTSCRPVSFEDVSGCILVVLHLGVLF